MLIFLLTDNPDQVATLADGLRAAGHLVRTHPADTDPAATGDGRTGDRRPDAVIAPGPEPSEALRQYAKAEPPPCVIALLDEEGLSRWAPDGPYTDFVLAPFRAAELSARVALHHCHDRDSAEVIQSGSLLIDVSNYSVHVHNERIELTFKEYELLKFLVSHPGRVFTRESLLEQVWGYDYWGGSRTIDVHIRRIRSKLPASIASLIETVHQVGYRYASPRD